MVGIGILEYRGIVGIVGSTVDNAHWAATVGIDVSKCRGVVGIVGMTFEHAQ